MKAPTEADFLKAMKSFAAAIDRQDRKRALSVAEKIEDMMWNVAPNEYAPRFEEHILDFEELDRRLVALEPWETWEHEESGTIVYLVPDYDQPRKGGKTPVTMVQIAAAFQLIRVAHGSSVYKDLGVSASTVSKWVNGKAIPRKSTLIQLLFDLQSYPSGIEFTTGSEAGVSTTPFGMIVNFHAFDLQSVAWAYNSWVKSKKES